MKLLKVLTIVLFSLFLFFSVSFTQENSTPGTGTNNQSQNNIPGNVTGTEIEKTVPDEIKTEKVQEIHDSSVKKKTPVNETKSENQKTGNKINPEKKAKPDSATAKEETTQVKMDGDLLLINEGNFRYKRIPDIKLIDIKPEASNNGIPASETAKSVQNSSTGQGLSKTATDIIVKGGVLLLILLIFVLYKSRMSGPGTKSSKKRNVLNSYRK